MTTSPTLPPGWERWEDIIRLALKQAQKAEARGDVPVGAVLLSAQGEILARSCNSPLFAHDPTAHAEILALREGARKIRNYRLEGTILVATLEPCLMCPGSPGARPGGRSGLRRSRPQGRGRGLSAGRREPGLPEPPLLGSGRGPGRGVRGHTQKFLPGPARENREYRLAPACFPLPSATCFLLGQ